MKIHRHLHYISRHPVVVIAACLLIAIFIAWLSLPTYKTKAETLEVSATVNAPPPTSPAIITSPVDQQHINTIPLTVSGTCGDGAYVVLYRNGQPSGTAPCTTGSFSLQTDLSPGANQLLVKNYNITDNEGPTSPSITVFYDIPSPEPPLPPTASIGLSISSIDGIPYTQGRIYTTSPYPRVQGYATPFSKVAINYLPSGFTCLVTADANGQWACKLASGLPAGNHQVVVSGVSPQGVETTLSPFLITVSGELSPSNPGVTAGGGILILYNPEKYKVYQTGEVWKGDISILGGVTPYDLLVDWGDETTSHYKQATSQPFTISHAYKKAGVYRPILHATDQRSNKATLQLFIVVTDPKVEDLPASTTPPPFIILVTAVVGVVATAIILTEISLVIGSFFPHPPSSGPKPH